MKNIFLRLVAAFISSYRNDMLLIAEFHSVICFGNPKSTFSRWRLFLSHGCATMSSLVSISCCLTLPQCLVTNREIQKKISKHQTEQNTTKPKKQLFWLRHEKKMILCFHALCSYLLLRNKFLKKCLKFWLMCCRLT